MKAPQTYPALPIFDQPKLPAKTVLVVFDGGTPCNIPRLGYGIGYGSYRINDRPIVRLNHQRPMSANAAEILTLARAIEETSIVFGKEVRLKITGDSRIALGWVKKKKMPGFATSEEFKDAIAALRNAMRGFENIETEWKPRANSVAIFGH